jgi:DNA-binding transcriptional ArsR family regulator
MVHTEKQELYTKQAEIVKALAHPIRLAVVDFLKDGEQCVCHIAEYIGTAQPNLSKHLAVMSAAGVLSQRKEGLKVYYKLRCPCVGEFVGCVAGVIREQASEAQRIAKTLEEVKK